nr:MAG TPA: hypothetical protein [Caudoviricetes sp.]
MENIEITNEYDIKILNLIFKKLFDNQIDYSTKQINEILNSEFSFFKRKRIIKQTQESSTQLFSQNILEAYFFVEKMFDNDIKEIYENIKQANNIIQNEEKKKYYLEKNHLMLDEIIEFKEKQFLKTLKLYCSDLYLYGKTYNFPYRKQYDYAIYKIYYNPKNDSTILAMLQYLKNDEYKELESLKLKDKNEYINKLTMIIDTFKVLINIEKIVNENYILNKRLNIFKQIVSFYESKNWEMVINLISIQMEGLFFDYTRFVEMNENKKAKRKSSLKNKIAVLEDNYYGNILLPYFKFDFPTIRNTIAHEGIMEFDNIEKTAKELILICYNLLGMFTASYLPYNNLIFLFNSIEKDNKKISFIEKILYNLDLFDSVINKDEESNVYKLLCNPNQLEDKLTGYKLYNGINAYEYAKKILEKISDENVLEDIYNQLNLEYQFSEGMLNVFKNLSKNLLNYFRVNSKQKNYCQLILKKINDINIQKDKSKQYK